jgi:aspartate racemase
MTSNYMSTYFSSEDIEVISPSLGDLDFIDALRKKIYSNSETPSDLNSYNNLLSTYSHKAPVLIACTELSIINTSIPVLDMVKLQVLKAIALYNQIK